MNPCNVLILPHQLFKPSSLLRQATTIYLIEDPYYLQPTFHVQKLCLHVASMRSYEAMLQKKYPTTRIMYLSTSSVSYASFRSMKHTHMFHPIDYKSVQHWKSKYMTFHETPAFLTSMNMCAAYHSQYGKQKRYSHVHFYKWQRVRLQLFVDVKNQPLYGQWSFDKENRKPFKPSYQEPTIQSYTNIYIKQAKEYVQKHFPKAFGEIHDTFHYPVTHVQAKIHLKRFLQHKLQTFGDTQDAISSTVVYGQHSIISSSLNIGLLTPNEVIHAIQTVYDTYTNTKKKEVYASMEGFLRQIVGWREYMRFIYMFHYKELQSSFQKDIFTNKLPSSWFTGNTSLVVLNHCIRKVQQYAYLHHIERLMIINNLGMLYEIQPKEMYKWFMICFIDSYDWVMLPNVRMNYNALDTSVRFMSRVYVSSDNYLRKMSNFRTKEDDQQIHMLYQQFLKKYKTILKKDYVLAAQLKRFYT